MTQTLDTAAVLNRLPRETPVSAEVLATSLGLTPREVVPVLNAARDEGRAVRVSTNVSGHCGWRLP